MLVDTVLKRFTSLLHRDSSFVNKLSQLHISLGQSTAVVGNQCYLNLSKRRRKGLQSHFDLCHVGLVAIHWESRVSL